ncbi:MAG: POTRA domain-containing protein [Terriglobales bacterium]
MVAQERNVRIADVTVTVEEGLRYRLGEISFKGGTVFPADEMRRMFPMQAGEVFNTEKMREGIQNLRKLYGTQGYINLTPVPVSTSDDSRQTVDVIFDLDEGKLFSFGPLVLDGPEPHAGARKALLESWKKLQGKPFDWDALQQWLRKNRLKWPSAAPTPVETSQDQTSQVVTVRLSFP